MNVYTLNIQMYYNHIHNQLTSPDYAYGCVTHPAELSLEKRCISINQLIIL